MDFAESNSNVRATPNKPLEYNDSIINSELAPPKGISQKRLFNEELSDDDRFVRLEMAVQKLHDDFYTYLPAIENLSEIESEIQLLVEQLKTLVAAPPPPAMNAPVPLAAEDKQAAPPPAQQVPVQAPDTAPAAPKAQSAPMPSKQAIPSSSLQIQNIRAAAHSEKTRVVFDITGPTTPGFNFDDAENIIVITSSAPVAAQNLATIKKQGMIEDIQVLENNGKSEIIIAVKAPSSVGKPVMLKPGKNSAFYRYYFDIFR